MVALPQRPCRLAAALRCSRAAVDPPTVTARRAMESNLVELGPVFEQRALGVAGGGWRWQAEAEKKWHWEGELVVVWLLLDNARCPWRC